MDSIGYIYSITNKLSGKTYVGQTIGKINTRWSQHRTQGKSGIGKAILKYGVNNFIFEIEEEIEYTDKKIAKDILNKFEIIYINKYNTMSPKGYNIVTGGYGGTGRKVSDETKKILSIKSKKYYNSLSKEDKRNKVKGLLLSDTWNKGKTGIYSEEIRKSMGRSGAESSHSIPIYCIELDKEFVSIKEASDCTNTSIGSIIRACKKEYYTANNMHWIRR